MAGIKACADIVAPQVGSFAAANVEAAHAAGLKVAAWTIEGAQSDIQALIRLGVDGIFEDNTRMARTGLGAIPGGDGRRRHARLGRPIWDRHPPGLRLRRRRRHQHPRRGAGNDVMVATGQGDEIRFRPGDGIDLVVANESTAIRFDALAAGDVVVTAMDGDLNLRGTRDTSRGPNIPHGTDALAIRDAGDPAHRPAAIRFADGTTWSAADLVARAVAWTDATVTDFGPRIDTVQFDRVTFASFAEVRARSAQVGADVVVTAGPDHTLTLQNTMLGTLSSGNFHFA
ncbi:hypothetical protein LRS73_33035 (plasmid) [Methylobacterium currus]|uniref:glycerophosphodiester phosphodiesterase family protein n=1 Tax=Methylobacterium currus TaxID=2051553 RepID=UPI001E40C208|nr:glycerophosphodiester phosphodiesterase family protein [Methylobacterium currus]UHC20182.1 hypothetical protein LRS73_33035 [Methylobacterium currus]